jgi:hypothetical protein
MFCPSCGKNINDGASFCKFCGANLVATQSQLAAESRTTPEPKEKKDFFERDKVKSTDTPDETRVKKQWNNFLKIFWLLFVLKLITHSAETTQDESVAAAFFILQFPVILGMVILMGYYSYKFTGKKVQWLSGLLGLLWIAIIGIFIGFWHVQRLKNQKLGIKNKMKSFQLSK